MTTLLVTGGAGFIGSNFIRHWLSRHPTDRVVNLDLLTYAGDRSSLADVEREHDDGYVFVHGDIADAACVGTTMAAHHPDVIVNFAAESHNSRAVLDPTLFVRTNVVGTQTLLEAARVARVARFHHVSTCEVYGDLALDSPERFTEDSPYRPHTPYLPKDSDLSAWSQRQLNAIADRLNTRPRKTLGYQTPAEILGRDLAPAG